MTPDERPVVIGYDGSDEAREAVREAATLFGGRRLLVVSVWEPGLAVAMAPLGDPTGVGFVPPSPEEVVAVDRAQHDHASSVADAGAALARELGARAEPLPVPEEARVADTIAALAQEYDAAVVVVGTRGLGAVKARLLGSTSRDLLHRTHLPVLVVRAPQP